MNKIFSLKDDFNLSAPKLNLIYVFICQKNIKWQDWVFAIENDELVYSRPNKEAIALEHIFAFVQVEFQMFLFLQIQEENTV